MNLKYKSGYETIQNKVCMSTKSTIFKLIKLNNNVFYLLYIIASDLS
jgi:hypothetical protein